MKTKFFLLVTVLFYTVSLHAQESYSGTCGVNVTWRINTLAYDEYGNPYLPHGINGDTLYIEGTGEMSDFRDYNSAPWNAIYTYDIRHISIQEGVTYIGKYAFTNMCYYSGNGLWITIPNTVTTIGYGAFWQSHISTINIPNSVTTIGKYAFHQCRLYSIDIPSSVTLIDTGAFRYCTELSSFNVAANNPNYSSPNGLLCDKGQTLLIQCPSSQQESEFSLPNTLTTIGRYAFAGCCYQNITIPYSVTTIEDYAFADCVSLKSMTIPSNVTNIGNNLFLRCLQLKNINVELDNPNYSSIGGVLFNKAQDTLISYPPGRIGAYSIPNGVVTIANGAFYYCEKLTAINFPNTITEIENGAFYYCTSLVSVVIPDGVTTIKSSFRGCRNLSIITIGKNVKTIEDYAFAECESLREVLIPEGVKTIGNGAFHRTNLTIITIASTVDSIGHMAFDSDYNELETVYNYAVKPQLVTQDVFCDSQWNEINATLYVPEGSIPLYQAADVWREFNPILPLPKTEAIDNITVDGFQYNFAHKVLRDGQIFIIRGDKTYTLQGQEVR